MSEFLSTCTFAARIETIPGDALTKFVVRVTQKTFFTKFVLGALRGAAADGSYGVSVRKEYSLDAEGGACFAWVIILWGDQEKGVRAMQELALSLEPKTHSPPPALDAPATLAPTAPALVLPTHIRERLVEGADPSSRQLRRSIPMKHVRVSDRNLPGQGRGFAESGIINSMSFRDDGQPSWTKERL